MQPLYMYSASYYSMNVKVPFALFCNKFCMIGPPKNLLGKLCILPGDFYYYLACFKSSTFHRFIRGRSSEGTEGYPGSRTTPKIWTGGPCLLAAKLI